MKGHRLQALVYSLIIFILLSVAYNLSPVFAASELGQARINAASPLYFLKSAKEIFQLKLAKITQQEANLRLQFADARLEEVNSLIHTPNEGLIEPTLNRYLANLGELGSIVDLGSNKVQVQFVPMVITNMKVLQAEYYQISDSRAKRSARATINNLSLWDLNLIKKLTVLKKYSLAEQVKESRLSGCRFLEKEASGAASEVEKEILQRKAEECLKAGF